MLVAGPDGHVTGLNHAARRLLGTTGDPLGLDYRDVLPLVDSAGADWWSCVTPYRGLRTRTGHPERLLELRGTGRALLVTARYVREVPGGPVVRLVVAFRDDRARRRADRDRSDLVSPVALGPDVTPGRAAQGGRRYLRGPAGRRFDRGGRS